MRPMLLAGALSLLAVPCATGGCAPGTINDYEAKLVPVGAPIPDVAVLGLDGQPLPLSSLRGKTLLVNFWFYH